MNEFATGYVPQPAKYAGSLCVGYKCTCLSNRNLSGFREHRTWKFSKNDHLILTRTDDRTVHAFFLKIFQKSNDQSFILLESQLIVYVTHISYASLVKMLNI